MFAAMKTYYEVLGRLFGNGYLIGLMEAAGYNSSRISLCLMIGGGIFCFFLLIHRSRGARLFLYFCVMCRYRVKNWFIIYFRKYPRTEG